MLVRGRPVGVILRDHKLPLPGRQKANKICSSGGRYFSSRNCFSDGAFFGMGVVLRGSALGLRMTVILVTGRALLPWIVLVTEFSRGWVLL